MSFGSNSQRSNTQFWRLNGKECVFQKKEKTQDGWRWNTEETFTSFDGKLTNTELKSWKDDDGEKWKAVFEFEGDEGERALLDIKFINELVHILNSLAVVNTEKVPNTKLVNALDKPSPFGRNVKFNVWGTKVGNRTYVNCSVYLDGEKTEWAFKPEVMNHMRADLKETGGEAIRRFYDAHIKPLADQYNLVTKKDGTDADNYFPPAEAEPKEEFDPDDVPF